MFNYLKPKFQGLDALFGGSDAGSSGAAQQGIYNQQAIDEMRRQFDITQGNIQPYMDAGTSALGNIQDTATPEGLDALLAQIMGTGTFGSLVDRRTNAVNSNLAASGLMRSGTAIKEAANIPTDLALMLEGLLTGRQTGLANTGVNAATGLGQIGQANAGAIANILNNSGQAAANGAVTDAQSKAQGGQNLLNTAVGIGSLIFSDPSLKENVEQVSQINDLGVYQWDWKEDTKGTLVDGCSNMGFMADEVKEKYPEYVYEFGGFMMIDYPALLDKLEEAA